MTALLAPLVFIIVLLAMAIRIIPEYQRGVVFFLGRFQGVKGPGLVIIIPGIQQMTRVDLRVITLDVPSQDLISKDNVTVKVNAVLYFRVVDPQKAIIQVEDYYNATSQISQTTLRSVLGKHDLDEMLSERDKLNVDIQSIIDTQTDAWGIKVTIINTNPAALQLRYLQTMNDMAGKNTSTLIFPLPIDLLKQFAGK